MESQGINRDICDTYHCDKVVLVTNLFFSYNNIHRLIKYLFSFSSLITLFCSIANCAELYKAGNKTNGVYTIDPDGLGSFDVFCDQTTAGGGWTVLQKRQDGSVDFNRSWWDYKHGFGKLNGEFWLGLDKINRLTWRTKNKLRVDLENAAGKTAYAEYDLFAVETESKNYALSVGSYSQGNLTSTRNILLLSLNRTIVTVITLPGLACPRLSIRGSERKQRRGKKASESSTHFLGN